MAEENKEKQGGTVAFVKSMLGIKNEKPSSLEVFNKEQAYKFLQRVMKFGVLDWKKQDIGWFEKQLKSGVIAQGRVALTDKITAYLYLAQICYQNHLDKKEQSYVNNLLDIVKLVDNLIGNKHFEIGKLDHQSQVEIYLNFARICAILCTVGMADAYFDKTSDLYQKVNKLVTGKFDIEIYDEIKQFHQQHYALWQKKYEREVLQEYDTAVEYKNDNSYIAALTCFESFLKSLFSFMISFDKEMYINLVLAQLYEMGNDCMTNNSCEVALKFYLLAEEYGDYQASLAIANYYLNTKTQDFSEAAIHFQLAYDNARMELNKDEVLKKLQSAIHDYPAAQELRDLMSRIANEKIEYMQQKLAVVLETDSEEEGYNEEDGSDIEMTTIMTVSQLTV